MPKRKMEFESEAVPTSYGPVTPPIYRKLYTNDFLDKMSEVGETLEFLDAAAGVANILHDLDEECDCPTCTEVREIAGSYE